MAASPPSQISSFSQPPARPRSPRAARPAKLAFLRALLAAALLAAAANALACNDGSNAGAGDHASPTDVPGALYPEDQRLFEALGFSRALHPIPFDPQAHAVRAGNQRAVRSADCRSCHESVYDNWHASRHRVSFTNPLYKESHAREPSNWCVNCHAPFMRPGGNPSNLAHRVQAEDGISCITCHVREGRVLAAGRPEIQATDAGPAHDYQILPELASAEFCASCHQFNFLTAESARPHALDFQYAPLVMQDTFEEWRSSSFGPRDESAGGQARGGQTCQSCHLLAGGKNSHRFPGGHDLELLAEAIGLQAERVGSDLANADGAGDGGNAASSDGVGVDGRGEWVRVTALTFGVGHAFPTGDLFRTLRVKLFDSDGRALHEELFRKSYAPRENLNDQSAREHAAKVLARDTVIPPPRDGDYIGSRSFYVSVPRGARELRYEMRIEYIEPFQQAFTHLPERMTRPVFERGTLQLD